MNELKIQILDALRKVHDPDLKKDLVSLNMIDKLLIQDATISFTLILTTPACPLQELLKQACIHAIRENIAGNFEIIIHTTSKITSTRFQATTLPEVKNIIAIASGKGGVGKSTLATHLALALAHQGTRVGLLDADIFGPSLPTMWNCENQKLNFVEQKGKKYIIPIEKYNVKLLSIGLLSRNQEAIIWRGPMASAALKQLLHDTKWGELDYLLIDLPPGTSDIHLTLTQTVSITGAVIITTPQKVSLIDAIKAIGMFKKEQIQVPILGLVENMSFFLSEREEAIPLYIFGKEGGKKLAAEESIPFLGQIPLLTMICQQGDAGICNKIISPFDSIAQNLAQQVSIRNAIHSPSSTVFFPSSP